MRIQTIAFLALSVALIPVEAVAGRCVDGIEGLAERLHIGSGSPVAGIDNPAPRRPRSLAGDASDWQAAIRRAKRAAPIAEEPEISPAALGLDGRFVVGHLLNSARAAAEKGRSRECFARLNAALEVVSPIPATEQNRDAP